MTTTMTSEPGDARVAGGFEVHLDVFEGPFDLQLALISKHKLDITEIALSSVTCCETTSLVIKTQKRKNKIRVISFLFLTCPS